MRLSVVFVITLAISVVVSATATWGLTYSTSYGELRDMASGFVGLATAATGDFSRLVRQLISDSSVLVAGILDTEYARSTAQLNETGQQFLQSTLDLMARAKNTTVQTQELLMALATSFGSFMGTVITDFKLVGTDYASQLRTESASRTQSMFSSMLQERILAIQRQARLYDLGLMDLSRRADQPLDNVTCNLLGVLCAASAELQQNIYLGAENGDDLLCDMNSVAAILYKQPAGPGAENAIFYQWPPYRSSLTGLDFAAYRQSCVAGSNSTFMNVTCANGTAMEYPDCRGECGFDPRCRAWYTVHRNVWPPRTQMSAVYIDVRSHAPTVTLSYPIYSGSPPTLKAVAASDFFFTDVNAFLETLSAAQLVAVVFNSSDLLVVGTSQPCANASALRAGVPIVTVCHPPLQKLGMWLTANQGLAHNVSLELAGMLWDVFPGVVDSFSYFVAVGMNKTQVYAVIDAITVEANETLHAVYEQQTASMAAVEKAALAEMDVVAAQRVASLQALQAQESAHLVAMQLQAAQALNASRQKSSQDLSNLTSSEMTAIQQLEDFHLSRVNNSIGTTFGAVVGIFMGILLLGSYGTWAVTKQIQQITQVIEDVAQMKVETLEVTQKSTIREVQRIEAALGVLVSRLAEYKTYMPAGLFQQGDHPEDVHPSPKSGPGDRPPPGPKRSPRGGGPSPTGSLSTLHSAGRTGASVLAFGAPVTVSTRLVRRSAVAMVVNVTRFQGELGQRSAGHIEALLNQLISTVHTTASKAQGNIDAILGDQVLVTFNAHFHCSDPPTAASTVALELIQALGEHRFPERVQVGLAAGAVYVGHLGYAAFKAMVAVGAPMKVASLLAHLSGFHKPVALLCPSVEERVKYHFSVQPVDLVSLPILGDSVPLYAKAVPIFSLEGRNAIQEDEWLYQIKADTSSRQWTETFQAVARANTLVEAQDTLGAYLTCHPTDALAHRLLFRLGRWQPRVGLTLAERPDGVQEATAVVSLV